MLKFIKNGYFLIIVLLLFCTQNQLFSQSDCDNQDDSDLVNFSSLSPVFMNYLRD